MKITIHADDPAEVCCTRVEEKETITGLLDGLELELGFFPRKGDRLSFGVGDYSLDAEVSCSYMNYCEPGNMHFKESHWGARYDVYLGEIEIVQRYED